MEGTFRSHQVPVRGHDRRAPQAARGVDAQLQAGGALRRSRAPCAPSWPNWRPRARGAWATTRTPTAACCCTTWSCPTSATSPWTVPRPGVTMAESTRVMGEFLAETMRLNLDAKNFRVFGPDETRSNRLDAVLDVTPRAWEAAIEPWRRPAGAGRPGHGDPQRAHHRGLDRGLHAHRAPRLLLLLRGVHPHHLVHVQPARQVAGRHPGHPLAAPDRLAQLPADLARLAAGPQRLLPPGPGVHRPRAHQEGRGHPRLSAAGRQHPAGGHRQLPAQPGPRQRDRRRQAAGAPVARHGLGHPPLLGRHRHLGVGQQRPGAASPTWSWPAPATCPPWRRWPPSTSCASTSRTSRSGW